MKLAQPATRVTIVALLVLAVLALVAPAVVARSEGAVAQGSGNVVEATVGRSVAVAGARSASAASMRSSLAGSTVSPVMFCEGFEGTLSSWQTSGAPTWGITSYRAATGSCSAYCAQSTIVAPGPYADDMSAWLKAGPFDLSGATAASLSYKLHLQSEQDCDAAICLVSLNGTNWYGWATSGDTQGWVERSRNLAAVPTIGSVCGKSQVWIAFKFESDDSVTDEGAYIDDIALTDETPPSVTGVGPVVGPTGSTVVLTGVGFAGATKVSFNGVEAQFSIDSGTQISATVPSGATSGLVKVTSPYGIGTSAVSFTVAAPPAITGITPAKGLAGTSVAVKGTDLDGATEVTFGGVAAAYRVDSSTVITAVVPVGAKTGVVKVTTAGGVATSATSFVVTVKPQLSRLSPTAAKRGVTVTLTGKDFGTKRGTGYVKFGSAKCTKVVSWSATRIRCKVPAKAKIGKLKVVVVTAGGSSAAKKLTVKR